MADLRVPPRHPRGLFEEDRPGAGTPAYPLIVEEGQPEGYASLDAAGLVPPAQLPSGSLNTKRVRAMVAMRA